MKQSVNIIYTIYNISYISNYGTPLSSTLVSYTCKRGHITPFCYVLDST